MQTYLLTLFIANHNADKHKAKEIGHTYEAFYYPNVFGLDLSDIIILLKIFRACKS